MHTTQRITLATGLFLLLTASGILRTVSAQNPGLAPHKVDKLALGEDETKQLLLLMDTDKNGKISKQEFMRFMEAEFDRLDRDKSGELAVSELAQSKVRVSHFANVGK